MKQADIFVVTGASDTLPATSDPMYQTSVLSLMIRKTLENVEAQGIDIVRTEVADFEAFEFDMNDFIDKSGQRLDDLLTTGVTTVIANLPDVLEIGAAYASGGATAVGGIILNKVIGHMFHVADSNAEHGSEIDLSAIEEQLEALNEKLENSESTGLAQIEDDLLTAINETIAGVSLTLANEVVSSIHTILSEYTINIVNDKIEHRFRGGRYPEED